jgi:Pentapeptide repeats (9 copies)
MHKTIPVSAASASTKQVFIPPTTYNEVCGKKIAIVTWLSTDTYKTPIDLSLNFPNISIITPNEAAGPMLHLGTVDPITQDPITFPLTDNSKPIMYKSILDKGIPTLIVSIESHKQIRKKCTTNPSNAQPLDITKECKLSIKTQNQDAYTLEFKPEFLADITINRELYLAIQSESITKFYKCTFDGDFSNLEFNKLELINCTFMGTFSKTSFKSCSIQHSHYDDLDLTNTAFDLNSSYFKTTFENSTLTDSFKATLNTHQHIHTHLPKKTSKSTLCNLL